MKLSITFSFSDKRSSRKGDRSRNSTSPRNSRLHTISEKSEDMDNSRGSGKKRDDRNEGSRRERLKDHKDHNSKRNEKERSHKRLERSETFNRDPSVSQEIPFEYTYRV